jgi:hypothetical protein
MGGLSSIVSACAELLGDVDVREDGTLADQPLLAFPPGPPAPAGTSDSTEPKADGSLDPAAGEPEPPGSSGAGMELGGESVTLVCETGSFRCTGAELEYCRGGLAWVDWQTCESAALCESEPAGRCLPAVCSPEVSRCTENVLETCNDDGTGWVVAAECATAAHCDTIEGECLETPCVPGQRRCNSELLEQCSTDQLGWDVIQDCLTPALCENDAAGSTRSVRNPGLSAAAARLREQR